MKTVAITGHSDGLGSSLAHTFDREGWTILGFSLPEFDIMDNEQRLKILIGATNADVFINCAYSRNKHDMSQVHMFAMMYDMWKNQEKHIVNSGSIVPSWTTSLFERDRSLYRAGKAALDASAEEAAMLKNKCRVTNVRPDWIGRYPNILKATDVSDLVYQIVRLGTTITVTSISLKGTIQ